MHVRRSLAAVLSVGSLLLATACAGDDLDASSDDADDEHLAGRPTPTSGGGPLTLAGQSFPEAALVAAMYEQLLDERRLRRRPSSWSTPATATWPTFPGSVDVVPEYVGGIVNFLNAQENGDDAEPFEAGDGAGARRRTAPTCSTRPASRCSTCPRRPTPTPSSSPRSTPSPRASPSSPTSRASPSSSPPPPTARAGSTARAASSDQYGIDVTEVLPLGYASDQTYQSVLDGESELGETSTTDGTLESQGLVVLEDDKQIQPAQNLVPAVSSRVPRARTRTSPTSSTR